MGKTEEETLLGYFSWFDSNENLTKIFSESSLLEIGEFDPYRYGKRVFKNLKKLSKIDQLLVLEQNTFLVDHNLNYTDKLSMMEGVEVRVPYLDPDLVKLAGHIPQNFKIKLKNPKYILKKVAEKYLPKDVIYRSKTGFGAPVDELIKNDFNSMIDMQLNESRIVKDDIFCYSTIKKMIIDNKMSKADYSYNLLSLLSIHSWLKQFPWSK